MIGMTSSSGGAGGSGGSVISWQTGTDAEIVEVVRQLDAGLITPAQTGWVAGDTRNIELGSFTSYPGGSATTQEARKVRLAILNIGGKELTNGKECNFVVGFVDNVAKSYWNPSSESGNAYQNSLIWQVEDNIYNALPSGIKPIFKQFKAVTGIQSSSSATTYNRYMASPAEAEVFGASTRCVQAEFDTLTKNAQFDYYISANSRIHRDSVDSDNQNWWERSPNYGDSYGACFIDSDGTPHDDYVREDCGVSPFGCI